MMWLTLFLDSSLKNTEESLWLYGFRPSDCLEPTKCDGGAGFCERRDALPVVLWMVGGRGVPVPRKELLGKAVSLTSTKVK